MQHWVDEEKIKFPLSIEIELTQRCNWNCNFCYNIWKNKECCSENIDISLEDMKKILKEADLNGVLNLRLSGGEPTLHPRFIEIIKAIHNYNIGISLFTNGTQINQENIELMEEYGVRHILLSLHGSEDVHNRWVNNRLAYGKVINAIKIVGKSKIELSIETILTQKSQMYDILEIAKVLEKFNIKEWILMPYVNTNKVDDEFTIKLERVNEIVAVLKSNYSCFKIRIPCSPKWCLGTYESINSASQLPDVSFDASCGAGIAWCSISYDGNVRHCPHSSVYAGKINDGIQCVYNKKVLPKVKSVTTNNDSCSKCIVVNKCKMGCYLDRIEKYE